MILPVNYDSLSAKQRQKVREEYIKLQNGLCQYCENSLYDQPFEDIANKKIHPHLYPDTFFKYSIHLHHDHETGMTLGVVHSYCNAVAWEYDKK